MTSEPAVSESPRLIARITGGFFLLTFLTGALAARLGSWFGVPVTRVRLAGDICYIVVSLLLYGVLKPVNRVLALLASCAGVVAMALGIIRLCALASSPIHNLVFLGIQSLLIGYLIVKSTFLPRALGVLVMLAGLAWLTFLSPHLGESMLPYILFPGIVGQGLLMLWLLVIGLDPQRWAEQANAAPKSGTAA